MSKQVPAKEESPAAATAFVVAKINDKWVRFKDKDSVPCGVDLVTEVIAAEMTVDDIGDLYSKIAGVSPKKFKNKKVAIESLAYQVAKMTVFDPSVPKPEPPPVKGGKATPSVNGEKKYARKTPDTFELLQPAELDKVMRGLAPQARELVLIMTDLAKEKGAVTFAGNDLGEFLKKPEVAARLRTKQDPLRILQYYKGALISKGLVRVS